MNKLGDIVIIDNDLDDLDLIGDALGSLKVSNKVLLFSRATEFLQYMREGNHLPFIILCDINMPNMNGLELFQFISNDAFLAARCFPFLFFSTGAGRKQITEAYKLHVQGYFKKPCTFEGLISMLASIIAYWDNSSHVVIDDKNLPKQFDATMMAT